MSEIQRSEIIPQNLPCGILVCLEYLKDCEQKLHRSSVSTNPDPKDLVATEVNPSLSPTGLSLQPNGECKTTGFKGGLPWPPRNLYKLFRVAPLQERVENQRCLLLSY